MSAHGAVGLAGVAPGLVPSRGHSALIPHACGLLFDPSLRAKLASRGRLAAHPAAPAWRPEIPPNRRCLIGRCMVSISRYALCSPQPGVPAARRGARRAAWVRRLSGLCVPCPVVRLSFSFITDSATVARSACPSRRAGPSPRCAVGRTNPALLP